MNKSKISSKFNTALMFIIVVLMLIILVVWIVLTLFLSAYEKSQSSYGINDYIQNISTEQVENLCSSLLAELSDLQDDSIIIENTKRDISNSTPVKYSRESNNEKTVYYLHDGNSYIEKVTLVPGKNVGFGFKKWTVSDEELLLTSIGQELTIKVPQDYELYCDDTLLDDSYITNNKTEYELLDGFYENKAYNLPYLKTYLTGSIVGDINLYGIDNNGNRVELENLNEDYYTDNCTSDEKAAIDVFIGKYVPAYVTFLSNSNRNTENNYYNVAQYVASGSDLENRLRDAKKSNGFNTSHGDEIEEIRIAHYMNCSNSYYLADVQFDYITTGMNGSKTEMNTNIKLMLKRGSNGVYQAVQMVQY